MKVVLVSPHPDDEIIGCWTLLKKGVVNYIIYIASEELTLERVDEAKNSAKHFGASHTFSMEHRFMNEVLTLEPDIILVPHYLDRHPLHRFVTSVVETHFKRDSYAIIYYTTDMNIHGLRRLSDWKEKKEALDKLYPSQKDLWKYDWKYFLFEGYETSDVMELLEK